MHRFLLLLLLLLLVLALLIPAAAVAAPTGSGPLCDMEDDAYPEDVDCTCTAEWQTTYGSYRRDCWVRGVQGTELCTWEIVRMVWTQPWYCAFVPGRPTCPKDRIISEKLICEGVCVSAGGYEIPQ